MFLARSEGRYSMRGQFLFNLNFCHDADFHVISCTSIAWLKSALSAWLDASMDRRQLPFSSMARRTRTRGTTTPLPCSSSSFTALASVLPRRARCSHFALATSLRVRLLLVAFLPTYVSDKGLVRPGSVCFALK